MRKAILAVAVLVVCAFAVNAYAYDRMPVEDMYDNSGNYIDISCSQGKIIGAAYFDFDNDSADAVSAICQMKDGSINIPKNGDWPSGGTNEVQEHKCNKNEKFVGIRYKDRDVTGKHKDAVDGISVACRDNRNGEIRWTYNDDLLGGRNWTEILAPNGKAVAGISYKDGGCGNASTDCVDSVTLLIKPVK